jgi:hypothetical protein
MNDLTVNVLNFAAGDGVASRDQESVRPSADDLDCQGTTCARTSFKNSIADSPTRRSGESAIFFE